MPNVVRGDRMSGLMVYLAGPGRHNEHAEPHVVAGDGAVMTWYRDVELDRGGALAIARHLDRPRKVFGTEVTTGVYELRQTGRAKDGQPSYERVRTGTKEAHVWHCSLSLRADEGELSDEKWGQIASDFVRAMDFDDDAMGDSVGDATRAPAVASGGGPSRASADASAGVSVDSWIEDVDGQGSGTPAGRAPCRWVAVRHGLSSDGNDHVHLAVSLVREDGTKASTHNDFHRAQQSARALEIVHGLQRLESSVAAEPGSTRGFTPAEQRRAEQRAEWAARTTVEKRDGAGAWHKLTPAQRREEVARRWRLNLPREILARKVRGCAAASADEAEFVRRLRRVGLLVRPRFAEGTQDVITGYSVAERPARRPGPGSVTAAGTGAGTALNAGPSTSLSERERPIWYGGNNLARDLGLTRLREHSGWPDDPVKASEAAAEWNAAYRNRRVAAPGREAAEPAPQATNRLAQQLAAVSAELRRIPLHDHAAWARTAREMSGVLAAWSVNIEATPGPLAHASHMLARSAQTYRRQDPMPPHARRVLAGTALLVATGARLGRGPVGQAAMMRELITLTAAIAGAAVAARQAQQAAQLRTVAETNLARVHDRIAAGEAARQVSHGATAAAATPTTVANDREGSPDPAMEPSAYPPPNRPLDRQLDPELRRLVELMKAGQTSATEATRSPVPSRLEKEPDRTAPRSPAHQNADRDADRGMGR